MTKKIYLAILIIFLSASVERVFAIDACDTVRTCVGKTLKFSVTSGKGSHYVDITNSDLTKNINQNMTLELWLKPEKQSGKVQYIGGMWGPAIEKYDSWVIFITPDDSLIFQINGLNESLGDEDDSRLAIPFASFYNNWNHFAFVADGTTGWLYIYVNSVLAGSFRNNLYPFSKMKTINNPDLSVQLGSTNALSNDMNLNRTFKGFMDEIRFWSKVLNTNDLICLKDKAQAGNEQGLTAYYRCNDSSYIYNLCDASGHKNHGFLRSGLSTVVSDRKDLGKVVVTPTVINDTIFCDSQKEYEFTVTDTALCATGTYLLEYQGSPNYFYFMNGTQEQILTSWRLTPLEPGVPAKIKVRVKLDFIGTIKTTLLFRNSNSCGYYHLNVPVTITRKSELSMSNLQIRFDSLKARCIEKSFIDSTLKICNTTDKSASPRNVTISSINLKMTEVFVLNYPALPKVLKPGECIDVKIRFTSRDTTSSYYDTLKIVTDDKCAPIVNLPLYGRVREVLAIWKRGTTQRLDSINFGRSCLNFPSDAVQYEWKNLIEKNITVTNIIIPANFIGKTFQYPVILEPNTGYQPNYFRFFPKTKGNFVDSIVFVVNSDGCTIHKPLYVKAKGYDADIKFSAQIVDFGTVIVGQENTLNVELTNNSEESLSASLYLRKGDPFYLTGGKNISVPAFSKRTFQLTFRPTTSGTFNDEVCLYENSCYQSYCIPVTGKAIVQTLSFEPEILKIENVLGCQFKEGKLEIQNVSGAQQTLKGFTITQAGSLFTLIDPAVLPNSATLNPNEKLSFTFRYTPNDNLNDRADRAYLDFQTQDNVRWSGKIYGSSINPKLYLTSEILFETLEVGGKLLDTIHLENISAFDIKIKDYTISAGFSMVYPASLSGRILKPRDTIQIIVQFAPTEDKLYSGNFSVNVEDPCPITAKTDLSGIGIIVPLDVPLKVISYGFVRPCDCQVRTIPLINNSFYFDMNVDSIWINGNNVAKPAPQFYSWYTFYSPNSILPYQIPPRATDTLYVKYCPRNLFVDTLVDNDARLFIKANGSGWQREFTTYLAGKQMQLIKYDSLRFYFPPTRVDTVSKPKYVHLKIPGLETNPAQVKVELSEIGFQPDERVFFASDSSGKDLPLSIDTTGQLTLKLEFKPRAVRYYENKLKITISSPCVHVDTTVILSGYGFAPAYGLSFTFDNFRKKPDTLRVVPCDTLIVPIFTSRNIPAGVVDVKCRLGYDTTKLKFLYAESDYTKAPCKSYKTTLTHAFSQLGGSEFLLKNACDIDSIKPVMTAYFLPKILNRDTLSMTLDSIHFDTEEIIMYNIVAENDYATIIIQKPDLTAQNSVDFDSVKVLDCVDRTIVLKNTGDVPLNLFKLLNLTNELSIQSSVPPLTEFLPVNDSIQITIRYCPRKSGVLNYYLTTMAEVPCIVLDSNLLQAIAYAPKFELGYDLENNFSIPDTLITKLGDTLTVPIYVDKDLSSTVNGIEYWIESLSFQLEMKYNPFALEYLDAKNTSNGIMTKVFNPGNLVLNFTKIDKLTKGKFAEVDFLSVLPDTNISSITLKASNFETDSIMFLEIIPQTDSASLISEGLCGLINLKYTGIIPILMQNVPNPWTKTTEIEFSISEKTFVNLEIYSIEGKLISKVIEGSQYKPGKYKVVLSSAGLSAGAYYYVLRTNTFNQSKLMLIVQ